MTKEIIKKEKNEIQEKKEIENLKKYVDTFLIHENLKSEEIEQFIEVARAQKLDPFKKELHVVAYGQGKDRVLSLITGYEVYLRRADLIPAYDFFETEFLGEFGKPDFRCKVKIFRKDKSRPLVHECYFNEFCAYKKNSDTLTKFWRKMPHFQIEKVTVSQGLRWAFPNDYENMPYIKEEINEIIDVTPEKENKKLLSKIKENMNKENEEEIKIIDTIGIELNEDGSKKNPEKKKESDNAKYNGKIHTVDELFPEKTKSKKSNYNPIDAYKNIFDNDRAKKLKESMKKEDFQYFYDLARSDPEDYKEEDYKKDLKIIEDYEKRIQEKGRK